ncbi:hypothetical protein Bca52824_081367 [Brassica carinata]|uniref:Uncharacterized protein n=1 Tax=Brassica carinata TaxID=52824 RepID=A0A8X7PG88_BRACI|nr:hypothetical protein Bca52824_081367 [Brassica carinata]
MPAPREGTNRAGCSKSKRKCNEVDQEPYIVRNAILDRVVLQNDRKFHVDKVLEILNELPGVIKWSPFHIAVVNHLKADEGNRLSFISFPSDDDKISYLEHMVGIKIYGGL